MSKELASLHISNNELQTICPQVVFYVGLHQPSDAHRFGRCMVSVNRLKNRKSFFRVGKWIMDSGAFSELANHGFYRDSPAVYAKHV